MIFSDPSFWVGLAFIIVISFLIKKFWSSIGHTLDSRSKKIKERINEAKELREEAQYLLSEYKRKQLNAQAEIRTISEETDKEIKQIRKKAKDILGNKFDIRNFHEVILSQGTVTLSILEERINNYIKKTKNE